MVKVFVTDGSSAKWHQLLDVAVVVGVVSKAIGAEFSGGIMPIHEQGGVWAFVIEIGHD